MDAINYFGSIVHLEPKCPKCETKVEYGVNTTFDEKKQTHSCNNCSTELI